MVQALQLGRAMVAIIENYQLENGDVEVPDGLGFLYEWNVEFIQASN